MRLGTDLGVLEILAFAVALAFGVVLLYCFWMLLATLAFWVVNLWHSAGALRGRLPDGTLADRDLPDVAPVQRDVPRADRVRGDGAGRGGDVRLEWQTLALAAGFSVVLFGITRWFWRLRAEELHRRVGVTSAAAQTWHYGLVSRWWAEFNLDGPEIDWFRQFVEAGQPALDAACGTGRLLVPYLRAGLDIDGCDISPDMLERVRERCERARDCRSRTSMPRRWTSSTSRAATGRSSSAVSSGLGGRREH